VTVQDKKKAPLAKAGLSKPVHNYAAFGINGLSSALGP